MVDKSRHCLGPVSCNDNQRKRTEKRGTGTRQRVSGNAKIPGNWQMFLANLDNKKELFSSQSQKITERQFPDDKHVYTTAGDQVHHIGNSPPMDQCNHEEADTRVIVHILHALQTSSLEWFILEIQMLS